ncbi:uncharacterized protein LOC128237950 [Mya arenaria]|uniref:uncharacterized protein LOC128237950 n=1 Tax=Mya arenaria TaxID=6604 RepID=UPI0022E95191|nr:uncharacterized protein LOC128237950 [Mya arenaria]
MHTYCGDGKSVVDEVVQTGSIEYHDDISITFTEDKGMQCDTDPLIEENQHLREENERLRKELKMMKWGVNIIKDDDKATRFYSASFYLRPKNAILEWRQYPSEGQAEATKFKFDFD